MKTRTIFAALVLLGSGVSALAIEHGIHGRERNTGTIASYLTGCGDVYTFNGIVGQTITADIDHSEYGGGQDFYLEVFGPGGSFLCSNDTNSTSRDPALTCLVQQSGAHQIVVTANGGSCFPALGDRNFFYLLNVSLRGKANDGPIQSAVSSSVNTQK